MPPQPIHARAFDQGQTPTISCVNLSETDLGVSFDDLVRALQKFVDEHFAPVWHTPCKLVKTTGRIPKLNWAIVFVDTKKDAQDEGWHDLTPHGLPLSMVFVKTTLDGGDSVSVTASHELAEMLVDPGVQMGAQGPRGVWYAYETADAVEADEFLVDGIAMTDFVYPAWFEGFHKPKSTKFDHLGKCTRPFEIRKGGYMSVFHGGRWKEKGPSRTRRKDFTTSFKKSEHHRARFRSDPREALNSKKSLGGS